MRGLLNMVLWKVVERPGKARGGSGLRRRWRKNGRVRQPNSSCVPAVIVTVHVRMRV
jgi:hypothetical protein